MFTNYSSEALVFFLLAILLAATWTDISRHRISNIVSLGGIALGLILQTWSLGFTGLVNGLGGVGLGLTLFLPFYALGGMAAGDVKLMAAVGAFLGPFQVMAAILMTLMAGGVLAGLVLLKRRGALPAFHRYALTLKCFYSTGKWIWVPPAADEAAATPFPYALAILVGTVGALGWLGHLNRLLSL